MTLLICPYQKVARRSPLLMPILDLITVFTARAYMKVSGLPFPRIDYLVHLAERSPIPALWFLVHFHRG